MACNVSTMHDVDYQNQDVLNYISIDVLNSLSTSKDI